MTDIAIVKLLLKKENYLKYTNVLHTLKTEQEIQKILTTIAIYYKQYEKHDYIAIDELREFYFLNNQTDRQNKIFSRIFDEIGQIEVSDSLASALVAQYLEKNAVAKIMEYSIPCLNGDVHDVIPTIETIIQEYKDKAYILEEEENVFADKSVATIMHLLDRSDGLRWNVNYLNDNIGPLPGGTLGHVYARVEAGKTAFCVDVIGTWAEQLKDEEEIFWFCNEENKPLIVQRAIQRILGVTREELGALVAANGFDHVDALFIERGGDKVHIVHDENLTFEKIEGILGKAKKPRAAIIDIADHVPFRGSAELATYMRLGDLYRKFRRLAAVFNVDLLTAGQASDSCDGKKFVNLDDMHNSKTDKPGALDYAIGIGKTYSDGDRRFLNLNKNKIGQTVKPIGTVIFNSPRIRFEDV